MIIPKVFDKNIVDSFFYTKKETDLIESFDLKSGNYLNWKFAYCHQIHSKICFEAEKYWFQWNWDAIWTMKKWLKCIVRVADCVPVLFCINLWKDKIVGVIHSGWQWTVKNIVKSTFQNIAKSLLKKWLIASNEDFFSKYIKNTKVFVWPSICRDCYQFWNEWENLFEHKYLKSKNDLLFINVKSKVLDQLLEIWIPFKNIETSGICTFENKDLCYSWRRWKDKWRMIAWIWIK